MRVPIVDGKNTELPPYYVDESGAITWDGVPLRFGHVQAIVYAIKNASGMGRNELLANAVSRWQMARFLSDAVLARLPSEVVLSQALEEMPDHPRAPSKPRRTKFLQIYGDPESLDLRAYESALAKWERETSDYEVLAALHEAHLPELQERVNNWKRFGGQDGIDRIIHFRKQLGNLLEKLNHYLENPELISGVLPFELLPPGLWDIPTLMRHLGGRNWRVQEIVPERLAHLFALEPIRVFEGEMHRNYREYFVFLYGDGGPAVLESPFHGNASYVLYRNWFTLCQNSKGELLRHRDVTRIIHYDIPGWRREICSQLAKKMPSQSNEY